MNNLAERVKKIRKDKRLTQQQMADRTCTCRSTYRKIEEGLAEPTADFIRNLHYEFGEDYDYLLDGENKLESRIYRNAQRLTYQEMLNLEEGIRLLNKLIGK